jgi:selenide,water dikinase
LQTSDDAAVYQMADDLALVQTVDFFPPVVDDPYLYGAIAAANSLSDVFAMGGEPMFALNISAWPDNLPLELLSEIFRGGADKAQEAGIVIAGGHTVTDDEPKYGLVVTGRINPRDVLTKAGAKPGDRLFVTKRFGTGLVTTAIKQQAATDEDADAAVQSMLQLNQQAARLAHEIGVHACTDITGFGLLGHATEVAVKSDVAIEIDHSAIPWLPGVDRYAAEGRFPGGANRNRDYYETLPEAGVTFAEGVSAEIQRLLFNPETSGGLLLSVAAERGDALLDAFAKAGHGIWELGTVRDGRGIVVR